MGASVLQWSDLARNPKRIAEIVAVEGEARIERRGDTPLLLIESDRYDNAVARLKTATQLLRYVVTYGSMETAVRETFAWSALMPEDARARFFKDFVETFAGCAALDIWGPLDQLVHEWKATAAIYADPVLAHELSRPLQTSESPGLVPRPEIPDAEAR